MSETDRKYKLKKEHPGQAAVEVELIKPKGVSVELISGYYEDGIGATARDSVAIIGIQCSTGVMAAVLNRRQLKWFREKLEEVERQILCE